MKFGLNFDHDITALFCEIDDFCKEYESHLGQSLIGNTPVASSGEGVLSLSEIIPKALNIITIFILPPNIKILKDRLLNRHEGQYKVIEKRMNKFQEEISHWNEYKYVVVNDDLEKCYKLILNIIQLEKKGEKLNQDSSEIKKTIDQLVK